MVGFQVGLRLNNLKLLRDSERVLEHTANLTRLRLSRSHRTLELGADFCRR
jgi:hypothetical protein